MSSPLGDSLFRGEAFEHHFREQESRGVLNTSIRRPWAITLASIGLLIASMAYALLARVEVVYRADGVLQLDPSIGSRKTSPAAMVRLNDKGSIPIRPGARVRLELLRPGGGRTPFIDARLVALTRAKRDQQPPSAAVSADSAGATLWLDIDPGQPAAVQAIALAAGGPGTSVRIHAMVGKARLWRLGWSVIAARLRG